MAPGQRLATVRCIVIAARILACKVAGVAIMTRVISVALDLLQGKIVYRKQMGHSRQTFFLRQVTHACQTRDVMTSCELMIPIRILIMLDAVNVICSSKSNWT